jgi:hypothetical protein
MLDNNLHYHRDDYLMDGKMNNIIDITSPSQLPKGKEFYLFNDENDLKLLTSDLNVTVYCLTRKIKKEYKEWYVCKEER